MVKCPLCEKNTNLKLKIKNYQIYNCKKCEISFLYPFPENIEKIYDKKYFEKWYLPYYDDRKKYFERLYLKLKNFIPEKGKILDIGCGVGILMKMFEEKKYEVIGYEISKFAINFCKENNLKVFDNFNFPEKSFDIITMMDVIAHVKNPLFYFEKSKKLLKEGGILIIKTPLHSNYMFFLAKLFSFTPKSKSILHIPAQIYHFNKKSIFEIAKMKNFKVEKVFIMKEFINRKFSILNVWKFFIEKSVVVILKNE
ncbi:MAG TPA: class I SAM-dependent methyltransferase [bacterium]|nr:class I SAM-dependent methyltransferase [bacterium]HOM27028.1 class I SAM-dependent methyltransferase [bacterium]